jgi:hypothetical protein
MFCSLNSESSPGRRVLLSSFIKAITATFATQSHLTGNHCSPHIRASGITDVSHCGCSLALSLSFAEEKTRSALTLSVCRSRIHWISISSVASKERRLRLDVSRKALVSYFFTLTVLMVIAVSSSFGLSLARDSLPTSVVAVLLLLVDDGTRCRTSLYSLRPSCPGPSRVLLSKLFALFLDRRFESCDDFCLIFDSSH